MPQGIFTPCVALVGDGSIICSDVVGLVALSCLGCYHLAVISWGWLSDFIENRRKKWINKDSRYRTYEQHVSETFYKHQTSVWWNRHQPLRLHHLYCCCFGWALGPFPCSPPLTASKKNQKIRRSVIRKEIIKASEMTRLGFPTISIHRRFC